MSQEKPETSGWIETLARAIGAWNRQDLDAFLETWHPDCEWRPAFPRSLEGVGTTYRGRDGIARAWHGVLAVWDEYLLDPEDARVVGDRLVAVGHVRARRVPDPSKLWGCGSRRPPGSRGNCMRAGKKRAR